MEPPDHETLKALVGSLSLQRAAICFLASPAPSYVTGTVPAADDGYGGYKA